MKSDFLIALTQMASERHLPKEQVLQAIEVALASAYKKDNPTMGQNLSVKLNPNTGEVLVYALRTVVETVEDVDREISLGDAKVIRNDVAVGEEIAEPEPLAVVSSRIAAQTAKQVLLQKTREAERELVYQEFLQHEGDIISGVVEQTEPGRAISLDVGRAQAILPYEEQVPTERYRRGHRTKVFVLSVRHSPKGPEIIVSRSHKDMLKRLFEIEVPEVYNGVVEIKAIAREAGIRSKVAVHATQQGVDPVGSCIGVRGNRIQSIVNELQGEKIDVVAWDPDPKQFIAKALSPSETVHVELFPGDQTAIVVVPDRQLSLAIGKEGQNTRLAARLTGWRLDIKGMTEWEEIREQRRLELAAAAQAEADDKTDKLVEATEGAEAPAEELVATASVDVVEQDAPVADVGQVAPAIAEVDVAAPVGTTAQLDEDAILEALILEEETSAPVSENGDEATVSFSVEDLESFTLDDVDVLDDGEEEEQEEEEEGEVILLPESPVLTPGAGVIRFAEDLVDDERGGGRRSGRGRRGGGGNRGNRRGGR
ncbi:MAG: transcription termination/antitermination protein NusA [Chloroflexi bacterium]|nr:transcription termination/antitermination protein NusA [Chloroflexota bacterium]